MVTCVLREYGFAEGARYGLEDEGLVVVTDTVCYGVALAFCKSSAGWGTTELSSVVPNKRAATECAIDRIQERGSDVVVTEAPAGVCSADSLAFAFVRTVAVAGVFGFLDRIGAVTKVTGIGERLVCGGIAGTRIDRS